MGFNDLAHDMAFARETLINSFALIPAEAGIQLAVELKALDSGSQLRSE